MPFLADIEDELDPSARQSHIFSAQEIPCPGGGSPKGAQSNDRRSSLETCTNELQGQLSRQHEHFGSKPN